MQSGFRHRKITPLCPESNGEAERFIQTLKKYFHTTTVGVGVRVGKLETLLSHFLRQYRTTTLHSTTKTSPFETFTGRKINVGIPDAPKDPIPTLVSTHIAENDG